MSDVGPAVVYLLCLATSLTCTALLARSYGRDRKALLLWVSLGFAAISANSLILVADLILLPHLDLWLARQVCTGAAIGLLLYGFLWEVDR